MVLPGVASIIFPFPVLVGGEVEFCANGFPLKVGLANTTKCKRCGVSTKQPFLVGAEDCAEFHNKSVKGFLPELEVFLDLALEYGNSNMAVCIIRSSIDSIRRFP